jgi:hypothetical protein
MATTYSKDNDISDKLSSVTLPTTLVIENYRKDAYNRINAKLRRIYIVPISSSDTTDQGVLCSIESNLSAGNILLAVATLHEVENVHEYGKLLIAKAESELKELTDEIVVLSLKAERDADDSDDVIDPPILKGNASDDYATFDRPMSGIENDAIEGVIDSKKYNSLEDNKTI